VTSISSKGILLQVHPEGNFCSIDSNSRHCSKRQKTRAAISEGDEAQPPQVLHYRIYYSDFNHGLSPANIGKAGVKPILKMMKLNY